MATESKIRSRSAKWFECSVRYQKTMDDGSERMVTEHYVVDAMSFTEAESAIIEHMQPYISGDFKVTGIRPAAYGEVFFCEEGNADRWYKVRIAFITIDEKTEKEKRSNVNYLVHANTFNQAVANIDKVMGTTAIDYVIASVAETQIMDVFEHNSAAKLKKEEPNDVPEYEQQPAAEGETAAE